MKTTALLPSTLVKYTLLFIFVFNLTLLIGCSDDPQQIITPPPQEVEYGTITGGVLDSVGGKGLEGAQITTTPPTKTVTSLETGYFQIDSIPVGQYTIHIHKDKYEDLDSSVTVVANNSYINFYMYPTNSYWTYYATMPEYKNGGIYSFYDGTIFSFQSDVFVGGGNNGQFVYGTHLLRPNTQNWISVFSNEAPSGIRENPYNNYIFCSTRDVIHYYTGNLIASADLHVSVNNGSSWENKIPGNVYSMTFASNNICFAVSIYWTGSTEINRLYKSLDGGLFWNEIDPIPGFEYSSVKQLFNNRIYLLSYSNDTARYSDDYGQTWNKKFLTYNEQSMIQGSILLQNNVLMTTFYQGTRYFGYSHDNGNTWTQGGLVPDSSFIFQGRVLQNGILYMRKENQGRGVFASVDNGNTWNFIGAGLPRNKVVHGISVDGMGYTYVCIGETNEGKRIYKSNNPNMSRIF